MRRSRNRRRGESAIAAALGQGAAAVGVAVARNPVPVGGTTGFLVVLAFVAANALWYQPFAHPGPLLETRGFMARGEPEAPPVPPATPRPQPRAAVELPSGEVTASVPPATAAGDPDVEKVQSILSELKLYSGTVDGLTGPLTRQAIEQYQRLVGLSVDGMITPALMRQLEGPGSVAEAAPLPVSAPRGKPATPAAADGRDRTDAPPPEIPDADIIKIQAGLRAFGNESIELDGLVGSRTSAAIREFQSLFGLDVTGRPDQALLAKMDEIGLID